MRRISTLELRLIEWGREYGGGKYEDTGWHGISPMYSLMKYHGRPPQGLNPKSTKDWTPADEVQRAVDTMLKDAGGFMLTEVLISHYQTPGLAMASRLERLRQLGCPMGETTYYRRLKEGRAIVARMLNLMDDSELIREVAMAS